jgi:beta-lactam-binding protein with PASTA domain
VPKLANKTLAVARKALVTRRCRLGKVTRAFSPRVKKGRIVKQGRRAGARLANGTRVAVTVSKGRKLPKTS